MIDRTRNARGDVVDARHPRPGGVEDGVANCGGKHGHASCVDVNAEWLDRIGEMHSDIRSDCHLGEPAGGVEVLESFDWRQ